MKRKTNLDRVDWIYTRNIDLDNRVIFFCPWQSDAVFSEDCWEVNDFTVQNLIKGLYTLDSIEHAPITIYWMSNGGDWDSGIAVYDYIKSIKSPVDMVAYGKVLSIGTIILQACRKRYLSENCLFLIHYGTAETREEHIKNVQRFAEELERENKLMEDIYLSRIREKHPRFTREKLQELMKYDKYMTPKEAVDLGLADGIIKQRRKK